ncbi:MAG: alpha-amylase/4-alpha-glucanotransferase domain-containing protein [Pirellulales bacterium]
MNQPIRFVLALHNHQPIGNFDHVFEQAYQDSYLPFLDVFERASELKLALHTSGCLFEWLDHHHPEYVDRLAALSREGRVEIIGGAFYEPILAMLPQRDRIGQIRRYTDWLGERLGATIRGMWIPERVWEPGLTRDLVDAGIEYTILDDYHFKSAGLAPEELHGYYVTEDEGRLLKVFPGSEPLRYVIPFAEPGKTIEYLAQLAAAHPQAVAVFGDDGEKFGTWPDTKRHVYDNGWLEQFFAQLVAHRDWICTTTRAEAIDNTPPIGKVYLPNCSYREMTEWSLPTDRLVEYERLVHEMEGDARWPALRQFVSGGIWRNFKIKYPESDEMYCRMIGVSRRLSEREEVRAGSNGQSDVQLEKIRRELYQAQCNCSYWHGAFGGIYLPHLRNAVYEHLIAADSMLERLDHDDQDWLKAEVSDFNLDNRPEVQLANNRLAVWLAPARGGQIYELDVRSICHNLLATLTRRPEAYHEKVRHGAGGGGDNCASIHDRVVFKQEGLDQRLQYDDHPRKSLIDHFFELETSIDAVSGPDCREGGDFALGEYESRLRRSDQRVQVKMSKAGNSWGQPLTITKSVTLSASSSTLDIAYLIEGIQKDHQHHFGVEFNFSGMPAGADDRYFVDPVRNVRLGQLGERIDEQNTVGIGLVDEWLGLGVNLEISRPSGIWTYPVEAVSQSEGGFEAIHQSVVVIPHWLVTADAEGRWTVSIKLAVDTSRAERRGIPHAHVVTPSFAANPAGT